MQQLTQRQADVLRWVTGYIESNGYPPTLREICSQFGFASTNAASDHLTALERKGWIQRAGGKLSRSIRLSAPHRRDYSRVPLETLANHLRQAGWTVTPPEAK